MRYKSLELTYKSIQKLIAAGAKTIAPAHGNIFPVKKLQDMLVHFHIRWDYPIVVVFEIR